MFRGDGAYVPIALSAVDMKLRLHEIVHVFDISLVPHPARALLDSGAHQEESSPKSRSSADGILHVVPRCRGNVSSHSFMFCANLLSSIDFSNSQDSAWQEGLSDV